MKNTTPEEDIVPNSVDNFINILVTQDSKMKDIDIAMGTIRFNLKSNFIKKVMAFVSLEENGETPVVRKSETTPKEKQDYNLKISQLQNPSLPADQALESSEGKVTLKMKVELQEVVLRLVNEQVRLCQ